MSCERYQIHLATLVAGQKQKQLQSVLKMTSEQQQQSDNLAALMVYQEGLPLSFFNKPGVLRFLNNLAPQYTPPSRTQLSETLLDRQYAAVKARVDEVVNSEQHLNIQFDEAKSSANNRILNISVGTAYGAFYYDNIDMGAATLSAETLGAKIEEVYTQITQAQLNRINSISGDSCSTNLAMFKQLQAQPALAHCFFIPCDAHSLQLLIKDICSHDTIKEVVSAVDNLVSHFKHSPKQYQIFKALQLQLLEKPLNLTIACVTRWGTHAKEFQRLIYNEQVLKRYLIEDGVDLTSSERAKAVSTTLLSSTFFPNLRALNECITPIVKLQEMAQSDAAHLAQVMERWVGIRHHLQQQQAIAPELFVNLWPKIEQRYTRQLSDLYSLAFWLMPRNVLSNRFSQANEQTKVLNCLQRYVKSEDHVITVQAFLEYYNRIEGFHAREMSWSFTGSTGGAKVFWTYHLNRVPALAGLALRVLNTIANSVPCERHFSAINWVHTPTRSTMTSDRVNKLLFIQLNLRVLERNEYDLDLVDLDEIDSKIPQAEIELREL